MDETETATIDWINSFNLPKPVENLSELRDGTILMQILNEISPSHFDKDLLSTQVAGNWALIAGNLRKLLRSMDDYFTHVLHKDIETSHIDVNLIAKGENDIDAVLDLIELVVGAAVMCDDKERFITNIFNLSHDSQAVLKGFVEQVMSRATDISADSSQVDNQGTRHDANTTPLIRPIDHSMDTSLEFGSPQGSGQSDELIRANEMIQHLQSEQQRLMSEIKALETSSSQYKSELTLMKEQNAQRDQELQAQMGDSLSISSAMEARNLKLQEQLEDAKREYDLKVVEMETLQATVRSMQKQLEAAQELQEKLEVDNQRQADELDIANSKLSRLNKAEQQVEKYQKKLEEMLEIKRQNKEFSEKIDQYLEQINDLEVANKGITSLNKLVEQYKSKTIELEREKFEAISTAQVKDQEVEDLKKALEQKKNSQAFLQEQVDTLENQVEQLQNQSLLMSPAPKSAGRSRSRTDSAAAEDSMDLNASGLLFEETESVTSLKEKVKRLERQLKQLTVVPPAAGETGLSESGSSAKAGEGGDALMLQAELDELRQLKADREKEVIACKKQIADLNRQLEKATSEASSTTPSTDASPGFQETQRKLAEAMNTIRLLENQLNEKESAFNQAQQEEGKFKLYAKQSLDKVSKQFIEFTQKSDKEIQALKAQVQYQRDKSLSQEEHRKNHEALISSAMYNIGLQIIDKQIGFQNHFGAGAGSSSQLASPYAYNSASKGPGVSSASFLDIQKEAVARQDMSFASEFSTPMSNAYSTPAANRVLPSTQSIQKGSTTAASAASAGKSLFHSPSAGSQENH